MAQPGHHEHRVAPTAAERGRRERQRRALWIALLANSGFLVVEIVGGLTFRSLALLADGAHMFSDVAALAIALVAQRLLVRPVTTKHSYGWQRAEILGAQANAIVMLAASAWIVFEAVQRIGSPEDVVGVGVLVVATAGLAVNVVSAWLLARAAGASLNMRGAFLHMFADALGSVAAIVAGVSILLWDARWVDPVASIAIAALVLWSTWGLLRDATHVLLEGTPRGTDPDAVRDAILEDDDVAAVHHLHVWNLASDVLALSAHVVLEGERSLHDAQASGDRLKAMLDDRYGITHSTLELECHPCAPEDEEQPSREANAER